MSEISDDLLTLEKSVLKAKRREIRKKLAYIDSLEEPGTIYNAQVHGSAQRLLNVHRITKYVKFCRCCALPQETPGAVIPFDFLDEQLDTGVGIYFYFYYIKFCIFISFICIGLSSIATIIFSLDYADDIKDYCQDKFGSFINTPINGTNETFLNNTNNFNNLSNLRRLDLKFSDYLNICHKYLNSTYRDSSGESIKSDWLTDMSSYNLKYYYDLFKFGESNVQIKIIHNVLFKYSIIYFITGITIIIASFLFVQYFWLLSQYEDFKEVSPSDYSLLIHNVPKINPNPDDDVKKIVSEISRYTPSPLEMHNILLCPRIVEIIDVVKKKYEEETKLYHVYNFERQKLLNEKYGFKNSNDLHYFQSFLCFNRKTPIQEIQKNIEDCKIKYKDFEDHILVDINKYNGGTFFLIFKTMRMRDYFYNFFPNSFLMRTLWCVRYFFESTILRACISEEKRYLSKLKVTLQLRENVEPYEVLWENMGYSWCERAIRSLTSFLASILLIAICLAIMVGLNALQRKATKKDLHIWKYVISAGISIIIAITNVIAKFVLKKLTFLERNEIRTDFYISYSFKLTIFYFVTIALLPVISNLIFGLKNCDILVNNLLMIFIINILLPPALFYFGPELLIKILRRTKAKMDLKDVPLEKSTYTQGELNDYFENPEMNMYYKYAYITNAILIPLFFMTIFPIGMIFSFGGLILTYISEYFYICYYKRPEILSSSLCRFYVSNFKWATFIFALGNYIFLSLMHEKQTLGWNLFNLIFFFAISIIPYQTIKINIINMEQSDINDLKYEDYFYFFSTDYEKLNPLSCKTFYQFYFHKLGENGIVNPNYIERIIERFRNLKEIELYLKMRRHINDYTASTQLNNLYVKNNIKKLNKYVFETNNIKQEDIIDKFNDEEFIKKNEILFESLQNFNKVLEFHKVSNGICNALIFLDIKFNINNKYKYYNYNPWKANYLFTQSYKEQRESNIAAIISLLDYKDDVSDDENSFIKCEKSYNFLPNIEEINKEFLEENNCKNINNSVNNINKENDNSKINLCINNNNNNSEITINHSYQESNQFLK